MWSKICEEVEAPRDAAGVRELYSDSRKDHFSRHGWSSRCHGTRVSIIALFLVLVMGAAAAITIHVLQARPFNSDSTKTLGETEDPDQQLEKDVKRDVERDVDKDVENYEQRAEKIAETFIKVDVPGSAMQHKLEAKFKEDIERDLGKFTEKNIKKVVGQDVKQDVKQDLPSPDQRNYEASGVIRIPSLEPKLKEQLVPLWPSLFCWCIMQTVGNNPYGWMEEDLIKQQLDKSMGIFSCNEWAVMTDEMLALNRWGPQGFPKIPKGINSNLDIPSWAIGSTQVGKGVETNPLNAMPFRTAWEALRKSKKLANHDWVVKVDPDAVWFPHRLRSHLKTYMPSHGNGRDAIFIKNCQRFNSMQGPIEIISRQGATTLQNNIQNCGANWGTGEDHFIENCLKQLGVPSIMEPGMLNDKYCDGYVNCANPQKVAFHPHKNTTRFMQCFNASKKAEQTKKLISSLRLT